ncbi:MAG: family 43 glycosylhydrolase [Clostridiales bacterium]|nr:family 43 glycosylhydrolase [Clostridiales bacterium]
MRRNAQAWNPYLPEWEYVPDGEPHIFEERLYVFGSHDTAGGSVYCPNDYVGWSAPLDDLSNWRCDGVIYQKNQTPGNEDSAQRLFAPDVAQGSDGRYYLYYGLSSSFFIHVAVCDRPTGKYQYYGTVHYPDGRPLTEHLPFDPAVLVDKDRVWLYYGFAPYGSQSIPAEQIAGGSCVELEPDMVTIRGESHVVLPHRGDAIGTPFEGHGYFEAPSIRKIRDTYYLVYSSEKSHELCYAVSRYPERGFSYGGVLCSNGDIGLNGRESPVAATGNNHGGLVEIGGQWYIFYHRHTHGTEFSRQGCAEPICLGDDGRFAMTEITSCGLNGGPLNGYQRYPAAIACHLTGPEGMGSSVGGKVISSELPAIYQEGGALPPAQRRQYIGNLSGGCVFGVKYLDFDSGVQGVRMSVRGAGMGEMSLRMDSPEGPSLGTFSLNGGENWHTVFGALQATTQGVHAVYFSLAGNGRWDVLDFQIIPEGVSIL